MGRDSFTLIDDGRPLDTAARVEAGRVRLGPAALEALGLTLTPEGLCGQGFCLPLRAGSDAGAGGELDLADLAETLGRPLALDLEERAAYLGAPAADRAAALASLQAPDFTLPDLDGRVHSLGSHRGRKVLLVAWASW